MYLILSPADIQYLTGVVIHEVGEVMIGIMNNKAIIFCDPRTSGLFDEYRFDIVGKRSDWESVLSGYAILYTDPDVLTQTLRDQFVGYGIELVMRPSPVKHQRRIKTSEELEKLKKSQNINKQVFEAMQPSLSLGVSEEEIARKIGILQLELGASGPSFPPIVAFGENSAIPHHSPTRRVLREGDIILIDMGVIYEGYCSDMTRCVVPDHV